MTWRHIDFWVSDRCIYGNKEAIYFNPDHQYHFELFLADLITALKPFIRRKFYLYEPQPHIFLAIEISCWAFIPLVWIIVFFFRRKRPGFILGLYLKSKHIKSEGDEYNGEGFLNVMNAMTDYYLFKKDCKLTHLIHCLLEFQHQFRDREIAFYKEMIKLYELKKKNVNDEETRHRNPILIKMKSIVELLETLSIDNQTGEDLICNLTKETDKEGVVKFILHIWKKKVK